MTTVDTETKSTSRRVKNLVIDLRALMRASIPFFILIICNIGVMIYFNVSLDQLREQINPSNTDMAYFAYRVSNSIMLPAFLVMAFCCILSTMVWLFLSHRIFGPIVSIKRRIRGLAEGDFESRLQLRARDEFKEVADELNQLAEKLQNSKK